MSPAEWARHCATDEVLFLYYGYYSITCENCLGFYVSPDHKSSEVSHLLGRVLKVLRVLFSLMESIVPALGRKILPSSLYERLARSYDALRSGHRGT